MSNHPITPLASAQINHDDDSNRAGRQGIPRLTPPPPGRPANTTLTDTADKQATCTERTTLDPTQSKRLHSRQTYSFMSALAKAANAMSVTANTAKLISHGRS